MATLPNEILEVSDRLSSLPGIGPKLSRRLALHLGIKGRKSAHVLSTKLQNLVDNINTCKICGNVTTTTPCNICDDTNRDNSTILIVEDSLDLYAIEEAGEYKGLFHVLNGVISPVNGIGPDELTINQLIQRVGENNEINEIIFGLNPNVEGDATSLYIKNEIEDLLSGKERECNFSKLAKGIPVGSDIEYMSSQTLIDSVTSRQSF